MKHQIPFLKNGIIKNLVRSLDVVWSFISKLNIVWNYCIYSRHFFWKMKKLLSFIFLVLLTSASNAATPSLKDFTINKNNTIYDKRNMNYFINQGYELVLQETRGIRTAYVLKKGKDYVGCRTETLSKVETCYIMELIKAE